MTDIETVINQRVAMRLGQAIIAEIAAVARSEHVAAQLHNALLEKTAAEDRLANSKKD